MIARPRAALFTLCSLILIAHTSSLRAQALMDSLATPSAMIDVGTQHVGPTRDALSVGVRASMSATTAPAPARGGQGLGQPEALMIVGGAALLVGAVVGGDAGNIFMIGGAVVGLIGLYRYLQ